MKQTATNRLIILISIITGLMLFFNATANTSKVSNEKGVDKMDSTLKTATFGAGCFWCVEAIFQDLKGVTNVVSGYAGGHVENPDYKQVTSGETGHAEVTQITFNPAEISFEDLLYVFWQTHDPTTLNRQGADVGTQYRSIILFHDDEQKKIAEQSKKEMDSNGSFKNPIVTEITAYTTFYKAEEYHQDYFNLNPNQPYCKLVIDPKVQKMKKQFKDKLK